MDKPLSPVEKFKSERVNLRIALMDPNDPTPEFGEGSTSEANSPFTTANHNGGADSGDNTAEFGEGSEGSFQETSLYAPRESDSRGFPGNSFHTLHHITADGLTNQPVEPFQHMVNGQSGKHNPSPPAWLIPGTQEWNKQVAKNGLEDMQTRRQAWIDQQAGEPTERSQAQAVIDALTPNVRMTVIGGQIKVACLNGYQWTEEDLHMVKANKQAIIALLSEKYKRGQTSRGYHDLPVGDTAP